MEFRTHPDWPYCVAYKGGLIELPSRVVNGVRELVIDQFNVAQMAAFRAHVEYLAECGDAGDDLPSAPPCEC